MLRNDKQQACIFLAAATAPHMRTTSWPTVNLCDRTNHRPSVGSLVRACAARQHSSGGKSLLLGISKCGDYLPTLLIHDARSVIRYAGCRMRGEDPHNMSTAVTTSRAWLRSLMSRRGTNVAAVALANKMPRVIWALLAHDRRYQASELNQGCFRQSTAVIFEARIAF
jgi:hypothetical protein